MDWINYPIHQRPQAPLLEKFDKFDTKLIKSKSRKKKEIKQELKEDPDRTNVEIAEKIGVDQSTVAKYRKEMEGKPEEKKAEVEKSDKMEETAVEVRGQLSEDWPKIKELLELTPV